MHADIKMELDDKEALRSSGPESVGLHFATFISIRV